MAAINDASGRSLQTGQLSLDIDKLLANPAATVLISGIQGKGVRAVMTGDFGFAVGAEYQSMFDIGALDTVSTFINRGTTALNSFLSTKNQVPQFRLKTPGLTSKQFIGSKELRFGVDLIFVSLRESDDIIKTVKNLAEYCMPQVVGKDIFGVQAAVYRSPMGFSANANTTKSQGLAAVSIGKWFKAHSVIIYDVHFNFSRVGSDAKGTPLYVTARVEFGPSIDISYSEFIGYFL